MSLSILKLKDYDLIILSNILLVGSRLIVWVIMILYVGGNILMLGNVYGVKG